MNGKFFDGTKRGKLDTFEWLVIVILGLFLAILTVYGYGYKASVMESAKIANFDKPQTSIFIYHHYTLTYQNNQAVELLLDDTFYNEGCDAWVAENEDGHNCMIASKADIQSIIERYNLSTP